QVFFGVVAVLASFFIGKRLGGTVLGFLSAVLVATCPAVVNAPPTYNFRDTARFDALVPRDVHRVRARCRVGCCLSGDDGRTAYEACGRPRSIACVER